MSASKGRKIRTKRLRDVYTNLHANPGNATYDSLVGRGIGKKLLETNIFAYHFNSGEITFQSTVMNRYCEENSALWKSGWTWLNW
jgi:hypothetical protein